MIAGTPMDAGTKMSDLSPYEQLLHDLQTLVETSPKYRAGCPEHEEMVADREKVIGRYGPIFSLQHMPRLTAEEYESFLYSENNRHWSRLYRMGLSAAQDMPALRAALSVLLDESQPIRGRLTDAFGHVKGIGKAIATAILTVAYPAKYGVWNGTSEAALRKYKLFPHASHGEGIGGHYEKINEILTRLRDAVGLDFWALDSTWWFLPPPQGNGSKTSNPSPGTTQTPIPEISTAWRDQQLTFVSYAREDSEFVQQLSQDLKAAGTPVWLDTANIRGGATWQHEIEKAISAATRVVFVLSPSSVNSRVALNEVSKALDEGKTVIPIVCRKCPTPLVVYNIQQIDFAANYESGFEELKKALTESA